MLDASYHHLISLCFTGTLLNLIILDEFTNIEEQKVANANVGWIGLTFVLTGLAGLRHKCHIKH